MNNEFHENNVTIIISIHGHYFIYIFDVYSDFKVGLQYDKSHINIKFLPKYFLKQCKRAIMVMTIIWALLNEIQSYLHHRKYGH